MELEEEIQNLEEKLLELYAQKRSLSRSSNDLECILNNIIDDCCLASQLLQQGTLTTNLNSGLIFADWAQDVLGNPKQFRTRRKRTLILDERLSDLLMSVAESVIEAKRYYLNSFHENSLITSIRQYADKIRHRRTWSHAEVERILLFLELESPSRKSKQFLLKFLSWIPDLK